MNQDSKMTLSSGSGLTILKVCCHADVASENRGDSKTLFCLTGGNRLRGSSFLPTLTSLLFLPPLFLTPRSFPLSQDSTEEGVHSRWRTASGLTRDTSASSPEISDENLPGLVKSPLLEYRSDWRIGSSLKFMRQSTLASSIVLLVAPYWSGWPWRNELEPPLVFAQRVACSLTSFAAAMLTLLPPDRVPWARAMRANVDLSFAIVTIVQNLFMFLLEVLDTEKMDIAVDSALNAYLGILAVNAVCQFPLSAYTSLGVATWTQVAWFIEYFLGDPAVSGLSFDVAHQEFGFPVTTAGQIMRQRDLRLVMFSSFLWLAAVTCIWTTYCR